MFTKITKISKLKKLKIKTILTFKISPLLSKSMARKEMEGVVRLGETH